ncbi:hypothetical protein [Opitutus sp. ER46]|uniref:hypothetical protein n=1 Tax=Opitutus sp. ER46 TaxID=2161864 RepID=UPI000D303768|nr:hypothetical protein [Opitutus sp. ER46]PTX91365.1 hypothetical protein DB354_15830 [Opitutus sp. ER46]
MKSIRLIPLFLLALAAPALVAAEQVAAGPKGGRLLTRSPEAVEFFVNAERRVEVAFYDAALKPLPPGDREVTVLAEPASGRVPVALEKHAEGFVSAAALPAGEPYRVVVQVREKAGARPQNFRLQLNLANCAECSHPEYACVCGH